MGTRCRLVLALVLAGACACAQAQDWPARPVRIVTGGAGNFNDLVARHLATGLSSRWRQAVYVENRPGAGLTVGTAFVAQSAPDGYTLVVSDRTALAAAPTLNKSLPYDPLRDLAPITLLAKSPLVLTAHPSVPARDLREFIDYLKRESRPMQFGDSGPATVNHVANEHFSHLVGVELVSVHYNGTPALMTALLAGQVKTGFVLAPVVMPHIRAAKVKPYAITSERRFAGAPDIPTVAELGMPDLESQYWIALLAPARTPQAIVRKVHGDVVEILQSPATRDMLLAQGAEPVPGTPGDLAGFMKSETAKWKRVMQVAGMRLD